MTSKLHNSIRSKSQIAVGLLIGLLTFNCFTIAKAVEYSVSGIISYEGSVEQKKFETRKSFELQVRGCDWYIQTIDQITGSKVEIGFQNETAYRLDTIFQTSQSTNSSKKHMGVIEDTEVPAGDDSLTSYLWLAFASSCCLQAMTNDSFQPVWMLDDNNLRGENFKMKVDLERLPVLPGLPKRIVYFNDGKFRAVDHHGERVTIMAPKNYDQGYVNAVLNIESFTNVANLMFPKEFSFVRFAIPESAIKRSLQSFVDGKKGKSGEYEGTTNLFVREKISATAVNIKPSITLSDFRPQPPLRLQYLDRRFAHSKLGVPFVPFAITNGQWPSMDDKRLTKATDIYRRGTQPPSSPRHSKNLMIGFFLGCTALIGLLYFRLKSPSSNITK